MPTTSAGNSAPPAATPVCGEQIADSLCAARWICGCCSRGASGRDWPDRRDRHRTTIPGCDRRFRPSGDRAAAGSVRNQWVGRTMHRESDWPHQWSYTHVGLVASVRLCGQPSAPVRLVSSHSMTHWITAEFLFHVANISPAVPGQVIRIDGARYLIVSYDKYNDQYRAAKDPGPYPSIVLYRPVCSCGYRGTLGTPSIGRALDAAQQHYIGEHILTKPPGVPQTTAIPYKYDVEPYWHT
jgi:hypothetical protein